jgi:acetate kinase
MYDPRGFHRYSWTRATFCNTQRSASLYLALNSGSSSIKFALFEVAIPLRRVFDGAIERIGLSDSALRVTGVDEADNFSRPVKATDRAAAIDALLSFVQEHAGADSFDAIGHRVVHGGPQYFEPQLFTDEMAENLRNFIIFDPEHLPDELQLVEAFRQRFPNVPQVACFDTTFHHDMRPFIANPTAIRGARIEALWVPRAFLCIPS